MAHRNVALITDGKVTHVVVYEDDPAQLPGYVRACLEAGTARDFLEVAAEEHDAVVELHEDEMCEPGAIVKDAKIKPKREGDKVGVVLVPTDAEGKKEGKPEVARFERTETRVEAQVEGEVAVIK